MTKYRTLFLHLSIVVLLREALGLKKKRRLVEHNDLDHLVGTWSEKEYRAFQKKIAEFEKIDENVWK